MLTIWHGSRIKIWPGRGGGGVLCTNVNMEMYRWHGYGLYLCQVCTKFGLFMGCKSLIYCRITATWVYLCVPNSPIFAEKEDMNLSSVVIGSFWKSRAAHSYPSPGLVSHSSSSTPHPRVVKMVREKWKHIKWYIFIPDTHTILILIVTWVYKRTSKANERSKMYSLSTQSVMHFVDCDHKWHLKSKSIMKNINGHVCSA